jgi:hypothetical protein
MNSIKEQIKNPIITAVVGLVVGTLFGLVVLGWWLWPVTWVNAPAASLSFNAKVEYMRTAIEAYGQNGDAAKAEARYASLGDNAGEVLDNIVQNPEGMSTNLISDFQSVVASAPEPVAEEPTSTRSILTILIPLLCVLLLVLAAFLLYIFVLRGRFAKSSEAGPTPAMQAEEAKRQATYTDYASTGAETPTAQFMASYKIGDDLFDDSFSIDSASGEFLGECGVGISETIGVGDPKKVAAFEVWLFDKNDIQTVTKVLMSSHAFYDDSIRQRLEAKGEPVLANPGNETVLETQTLQLVARVVEMDYGDGSMPAQSFFDHLILELAIWQK